MEHMGNSGGMSMGNGYGYSSNSFDTFLTGMLVLLVKLFMVVLVVAVVVGIVVWIKNNLFQGSSGSSDIFQSINSDPLLKTVTVVTLSIIGIFFVFGLLNSFTGSGAGMGYTPYGNMGGYYNGFSSNNSMATLLSLLIKTFSFVLVISLILAVVAYVKKQYDSGAFNSTKTEIPATSNTNVSTPEKTK